MSTSEKSPGARANEHTGPITSDTLSRATRLPSRQVSSRATAGGEVVKLQVQLENGARLTVKGREAWTLRELLDAGQTGVTPNERPAPRWSGYVYRLRKRGLTIETLREGHAGAYAGRHGRYVLRTLATVLSVTFADEAAKL